ncbi:MAG: hypothetical protein WKF37_17525 [Bryobacteraceae bacterium]
MHDLISHLEQHLKLQRRFLGFEGNFMQLASTSQKSFDGLGRSVTGGLDLPNRLIQN